MMNRLVVGTLFIFAFLVSIDATAFGQAVNNAQIHGRVVDAHGAAISDAQIKASQTATGLVRTTSSNSEGAYFF